MRRRPPAPGRRRAVRLPRPPLRVLQIENEGPRQPFRRKIDRKLRGWGGSPLEGRLVILEEPWAKFTLAEPAHREWLAGVVREQRFDVVMVGPVVAAGMNEVGTLQDVRAFGRLLQEVREAAGVLFAFWLTHHEVSVPGEYWPWRAG